MKIAVIGTGTTGSEVLNLLEDDQIVGPFDSSHPPTIEKLKSADAAIIFVPGSAVDDIINIVMDAEIATAWGSTGYDWPHEELDSELKKRETKWVHASNFSLGMNIARRCLKIIGNGSEILDEPEFSIHEIHHTGKQDAPSGTALAWERWLGKEATITSERKGDIKGIHQLKMETDFETIQLQHEAHDRAIFAEGALWAVRQLTDTSFEPGFYSMETLFDQKMG
ncbi:MAG TPA: dihydrodipicolinate reductase C-terminal domain-containing protein [Balneolaceae bacterium]|nr:dihydrodipicolinate reductase C-terminal domain-containing protein [Balneolaceae bacterium]